MEILGIGMPELIFILIIALIVLGPRDMQKAGRTIGRWLRQVVTSDGWKIFQQTTREIRTLPNRLMREAATEDLKDLEKDVRDALAPNQLPGGPSRPSQPASAQTAERRAVPETENTISPPPPPPAKDEEPHA